jgi:hypothetical protein
MANKQAGRKPLLGLLSLVAGLSMVAPATDAALITGTAVSSPTLPADLTALGTTDWAYWNSTSGTGVASMAPINTAAGVTHLIGSATPIDGTSGTLGVRGSSTVSAIAFSFTNGTTSTSRTDLAVAGVFNAKLQTTGYGVQTTVTLPDTQLYKVLIWVSGYNGTGTFTAVLPGVTGYQDASFSYGSGTKPARLYELQVQADHANDVLTLSHVLTATSNGASSSHVLIGGVAVSAVPEPTSMLLMAGAAGLMLARRRRA